MRETYPIYRIDYLQQRSRALRTLTRMRNVLATGRTGAFLYNNMDDSIAMGLAAARRVIKSLSETSSHVAEKFSG
ncbi:MAG: hypothetical protein AB1486_34160 [Planctomycetota bacterium]